MLDKSLEPLTAIGCGLAAAATGMLDAGLAAGAVVGVAGIIARFKGDCARHGLDEPKLLRNMQMRILREWDHHEQSQADRDTLTLADAAMGRHLRECMLDRAELAATSIDAREPYPRKASRLVADQLAKHDAMFALASDGAEPLARRFARHAIETALQTAREDKDYATLLAVDLLLAGNRAHAETHEKLDTADAKLDQILAMMAKSQNASNVSQETMLAIARRVAVVVHDIDGAVAQIHAAIDELIALREAAERGTNLGTLVDEALRRIADRNAANDFDAAAAEGERAFAALLAEEAKFAAAKLRLAKTNIAQARIRSDSASVARWIEEKVRIGEPAEIAQGLLAEAGQILAAGGGAATPFDMEVVYRLAVLASTSATDPATRGRAWQGRGVAAGMLGEVVERHHASKWFGEAQSSFKTALSVNTRQFMPKAWANIQLDCGGALIKQAARTDGDMARELVQEALIAFDQALDILTREEFPATWAAVQNNRGAALNRLAEITCGEERMNALKASVHAYEAALELRTREASPSQWARTQNNLGNALSLLGEDAAYVDALDYLERAITAFDAALEVDLAATAPLQSAKTQHNRAATLILLAQRQRGEVGLSALDAALESIDQTLEVFDARIWPPFHDAAMRKRTKALELKGVLRAEMGDAPTPPEPASPMRPSILHRP